MKFNKEVREILKNRILVTLGILFIIRIGTFLPVPGINLSELTFYLQTHSFAKNLVSTFAGKNTFVIGLFTLNIFPYINASIVVQLFVGIFPEFSKLQKEGDLKSKRSMSQVTRFITVLGAVVQSGALALYLKPILFNWNYLLAFEIVIWLTTGAMIVLWLSELITDYGLGNGASLLIYANIIASLPNIARSLLVENRFELSLFAGILILLVLLLSLYGIVFLQEGVRILPLVSSKQLIQESSRIENYLPLRLNQAGVMPIILTTAILVVPNSLMNSGFLPQMSLPIDLTVFYWIAYFGFVVLFSSFYANIVLNPKDLSDQLQKMAVTIPGIRPGIQTTFYLKQVMKRLTAIGGLILATLTTVPNFIESNLSTTLVTGLSSTSLLILTGVVLDLIREVKNIYYSNIYNNIYQ